MKKIATLILLLMAVTLDVTANTPCMTISGMSLCSAEENL